MQEGIIQDVKDFLEKGATIKTKLVNSKDWIKNTVISIDEAGNEFEIELKKKYIEDIIMIGDSIKVECQLEENNYILDGWITNISINKNESINIRVFAMQKVENNRKGERYDSYYGAMIRNAIAPEGIFGVVTNMSEGGLAFVAKDMFVVGEKMHISVFIDPEKVLEVKGEVVRKNENKKGFEYGVQFIAEESDLEMLDEVIEDLSADTIL